MPFEYFKQIGVKLLYTYLIFLYCVFSLNQTGDFAKWDSISELVCSINQNTEQLMVILVL